MVVRRFELDDAEQVSHLIETNLWRVLISDYSTQGIEALVPYFTPDKIIEDAERQLTIVAILDGEVVGTASLMESRVRTVFVDVDQHSRGIGRELMESIERHARQQQCSKLYLMASISARGFYEQLGYQTVQRVEHDVDGITLPMIHMEKLLSAY